MGNDIIKSCNEEVQYDQKLEKQNSIVSISNKLTNTEDFISKDNSIYKESKNTQFPNQKNQLTNKPPQEIIQSIFNNELSKSEKNLLILIQKKVKGFLYRNKYKYTIKNKQISHTKKLLNSLYAKNMKYNTKLAESLIGYKFNKHSELNKDKKNIIFHNSFIVYHSGNNNSFYYGDVNTKNQRHGFGFLLYNNGTKFEGNWIEDAFNGEGRCINSEGDLFEGNFSDWKLNGKGFERKIKGDVYIGEFENGLKSGFGIEETDAFEYKGQFVNDLKSGKGKIIYKKKKEEYEGEFTKGEINGIGIYSFKSGDVYKGEFSKGKMHGKGLYTWKSGEEYYGDYVNGVKEGNGVFKYINGKVFEGQFKMGKLWGSGKVKIQDTGKEYDVIFNNGKLIELNEKGL